MTDSGSENKEPAPEEPEVQLAETSTELPPKLRGLMGIGISEFRGPPWANPEILKDLDPETKSSLLTGALEAAIAKEGHEYDVATKKIDYESDAHKRSQVFVFAGLVVAVVAALLLSWLFLTYDSKELIVPVLTGLGGLGAGFIGGYGYAKRD